MKLKTKTFKYQKIIMNSVVLILLLIVLGYTIYTNYYKTSATPSTEAPITAEQQSDSTSEFKIVYCASTDLEVGTFADSNTEQNFYTLELPSNEVPVNAIYDLSILQGTRLKKALTKDEILTSSNLIKSSEWYEEGDRYIEQQFLEGVIPSTYLSLVGKYIDIVLFRINDVDPVVISKVEVISATDLRLGFHLNEQEREYLKEAATENGGFYIQIYIDESQKPSPVTYIPTYQ